MIKEFAVGGNDYIESQENLSEDDFWVGVPHQQWEYTSYEKE